MPFLVAYTCNEKKEFKMSCEYREMFLEKYFEEGIEKGMSEKEAAAYALKCAEEME
jgi:hypothetical protein